MLILIFSDMKKLLLFALAVFALASCKNDEPVPEEPKADKVSVLPESKEFDGNGGNVSVMVTSTGEWTLSTKDNAAYDWVSTDKTKGVDGDMIKFTVDANETEQARFAYYVFTCGKATAEFKITSFAGEIKPALITVDEKEITKDYNKGTFSVAVKYEDGVDYRALNAVIPEDVAWLKHVVTLEGDEAGTANMQFEYEALEGLDAREVAFTINYETVSVPMKMTQTPQYVIIPEAPMYTLGLEGGTLSINVTSNVEYNAEVITDGESWLTDYNLSEGVNSWKYSSYDGKREATIRFTEAAPAEGVEPIVAEVRVVQSNALITTVARMNNHRAVLSPVAPNKDVFKLGKNMTMEILVKPDANSFNSVSAILGIERRFLIRHSDGGNKGWWEVVYARNDKNWNGENEEVKVQGALLKADTWSHIAVTVGDGKISVYQDGDLKKTENLHYNMKDIDLSEKYNANNQTQEFAISYAYDNGRFFKGLVSEVRIWNRALTKEEINAKDHFYKVDPASEGLVAYWKMNDGEGSIYKDYTANGNNLSAQINHGVWSTANAAWETVSLPE